MTFCDPFQVRAIKQQEREELQRERQKYQNGSLELAFAPNRFVKNSSGGGQSHYTFQLPDLHADAYTYGMTFVEYVRLSLLQYAGFPGMAEWAEKPEADLALLTKDLIPF
jgi:hypothetical protein